MMKQVKVDNWGIYFLQRLKHFFNRTDYCDLTLQFMDNAQLKVHRLVLNACTEYFDVLERTCEMYEDYLIMPDDLQADVVVPIVNFMYTGQLEYKPEMLEKLIQTAQIMNIPVLAKLLDAQRGQRTYKSKAVAMPPKASTRPLAALNPVSTPQYLKRPAPLPPPSQPPPSKKPYVPEKRKSLLSETDPVFVKLRPTPRIGHSQPYIPIMSKQRYRPPAPGPTRCELPEELEENIFTDSFSTISYDSKPLIVHPETMKRYAAVKQHSLYTDVLSGRKSSTIDIIHNKIKKPMDTLFAEVNNYYDDDMQLNSEKTESKSYIFDQVINNTPKVTIESEDDKQGASIDHAKIISEVLKKYPYLVKGNKSIKLKILDTKQTTKSKKTPKKATKSPKVSKVKVEPAASDDTPSYPSDMLDSKEAAHLISLGAENVSGPWICMMCGTPGKALSFSSYYSFRRHLVEVHHEKIISNRCEYCGYKTNKINYLLYHLYTKHDVPPPLHCKFPKCSECGYIAQNPAHLVKHKMMHSTKKKKCSICYFEFSTTANLMRHIKATGHKVSTSFAQVHQDIQCVYCSKIFVREQNLYVHLKASHGLEAKRDGIVEDSDEEQIPDDELGIDDSEMALKRARRRSVPDPLRIKREPNLYNSTYDSEESVDALGSNNELVGVRKPAPAPVTQRLLNASFEVEIANQPEEDITNDEFNPKITVRDADTNEFILPNSEFTQSEQSQEVEYHVTDENQENIDTPLEQECSEETQDPVISDVLQPNNEESHQVQIVVSNEEEYKALMASNHPIIFDADGNPTKTLAVLTTPQAVPMLTTPMEIETENTDNMVILPDDYSCVSQTTNNGNIVVVYSQQLAGENKQYIVDHSFTQAQIVSAADLNSHYIQTSTGMTPSYTSAASSTIVQEQVVIPQSIVSWDGNVAQEIVTQQANTQEHIEILQEQENMAEESIEIANEVVDEQPNVPYEIQEQNDVSHSIEAESDSQGTLENIQLIENDSVSTDDIQIEESCSQSPVEDANNLSENVGQEQTSMEVSNEQLPSNEVEVEEEITHEETNETESTEVTEVQVTTTEVMTNGSNNEQYTKINNMNENAPKPHNIENLTSEWSDDDVETATVKQDGDAGTEEVTPDEAIVTENRFAVDESIENIQQEIESHSNENNLDQENTEIEKDLNQETTENDVEKSEMTEIIVLESQPSNLIKTQHKITSLLNDWVENDAQEEEEEDTEVNQKSCIEEAVESVVMEEATVMEIVSESGTTNVGKIAANPDIHNLVNDWEEEEEINE